MKKTTILPPLFLGLVLAGCSRTETDAKKISANDQPDANKPAYADQAATPTKDAPAASQVAVTPTPSSTLPTNAASDATRGASDSSPMTASSTPAESPTPAATIPDSSLALSNPTPSASPVMDPGSTDNVKPAGTGDIAELNITADDVKKELETSGRVVRSRIPGAGEPTGPMDSVLISQINTKLQADPGTAALKVTVEADKGVVTLTGSATSADQIAKAVMLSLNVSGATQVISLLKLESAP